MVHAFCEDLEEVVVGAAHRVAFHDMRLGGDAIEKLRGLAVVVLLQLNLHEGRYLQAEQALVQDGAIAADYSTALQRAHAPQAGRLGEPHGLGQFHIADAPPALERLQDSTLGAIELHAIFLLICYLNRWNIATERTGEAKIDKILR